MPSKKLGKVCLQAMMHRVVEGGERARGAQELLKLGRFDEAMDVAYEIEPMLYEANHLMQSLDSSDVLTGNPKSLRRRRPSQPSNPSLRALQHPFRPRARGLRQ